MKKRAHNKSSSAQYTPEGQHGVLVDHEQYLMRRLQQHGVGMLDAGVTTPDQRRENVRAAIAKVGPMVILGRGKTGKPVNYEQAFEAVYSEPFASKASAT